MVFGRGVPRKGNSRRSNREAQSFGSHAPSPRSRYRLGKCIGSAGLPKGAIQGRFAGLLEFSASPFDSSPAELSDNS